MEQTSWEPGQVQVPEEVLSTQGSQNPEGVGWGWVFCSWHLSPTRLPASPSSPALLSFFLNMFPPQPTFLGFRACVFRRSLFLCHGAPSCQVLDFPVLADNVLKPSAMDNATRDADGFVLTSKTLGSKYFLEPDIRCTVLAHQW